MIPSSLQGFEIAKKATLEFIDQFKENAEADDRELLKCVARTSLRTKLQEKLADQLTDIVVEAVLTIRKPDQMLDLFMVSSLTQWHCTKSVGLFNSSYVLQSKTANATNCDTAPSSMFSVCLCFPSPQKGKDWV